MSFTKISVLNNSSESNTSLQYLILAIHFFKQNTAR